MHIGFNLGFSRSFLAFAAVFQTVLWGAASAQPSDQADWAPPTMRLATRQFMSPVDGVFLEVQAEFLERGVSWVSAGDSTVRAAVQWTAVAYDSTGVVAGFAKSTARTGNLDTRGDFVDIVRIPLRPGPHVLELVVEDLGNPERPVLNHEVVVEIEPVKLLDISDIILVQGVAAAADPPTALTRSGREILPLLDDRISAEAERVMLYCELYGAGEEFGNGAPFLVSAGFRSADRPKEWVEGTLRWFRMDAAPVVPFLEALPAPGVGVFALEVQVLTPDRAVLASRRQWLEVVSVDDQNAAEAAAALPDFVLEYADRDSLLAQVETLLPIADAGERRSIEYVLQGAELRQLQSFLAQFWMVREPEDPAAAWRAYRREVAIADAEYGACPSREGHETDMGWILLRYGRPNTIVQRHNGTQYYPYEIWHYHKAGQFNNRRFLFYTPQAVGECFELLHSDHPQELRNSDWLDILRTREVGHSVVQTGLNQLGRRDTYSREEPEDLFFNPR